MRGLLRSGIVLAESTLIPSDPSRPRQKSRKTTECRLCGLPFTIGTAAERKYWVKRFSDRISLTCCIACLRLAVDGDRYAHLSPPPGGFAPLMQALRLASGGVPQYEWRTELLNRGSGYDDEGLILLLLLARRMPTASWYRSTYGGWLEALVATEALAPGSERREIGTLTTAEDGHTCYSLGELFLDDWLHRNDIPHTREPRYPEGNHRGDFQVGDIIIEYAGLTGIDNYDANLATKLAVAKQHKIKVITITPGDLSHWDKHHAKIGRQLGYPSTRPARGAIHTDDLRAIIGKLCLNEWPNPLTAPPHPKTEEWLPDPYNVGSVRRQCEGLWTRQVRTARGKPEVHTPGTDKNERDRLRRVRRRSPERYVDLEIDLQNRMAEACQSRTPMDFTDWWQLADADQTDDLAYDKKPSGRKLSTAARWAYESNQPEAALAILHELSETCADPWYPWDDVMARSLVRHGIQPDPVAAGLAAPSQPNDDN